MPQRPAHRRRPPQRASQPRRWRSAAACGPGCAASTPREHELELAPISSPHSQPRCTTPWGCLHELSLLCEPPTPALLLHPAACCLPRRRRRPAACRDTSDRGSSCQYGSTYQGSYYNYYTQFGWRAPASNATECCGACYERAHPYWQFATPRDCTCADRMFVRRFNPYDPELVSLGRSEFPFFPPAHFLPFFFCPSTPVLGWAGAANCRCQRHPW